MSIRSIMKLEYFKEPDTASNTTQNTVQPQKKVDYSAQYNQISSSIKSVEDRAKSVVSVLKQSNPNDAAYKNLQVPKPSMSDDTKKAITIAVVAITALAAGKSVVGAIMKAKMTGASPLPSSNQNNYSNANNKVDVPNNSQSSASPAAQTNAKPAQGTVANTIDAQANAKVGDTIQRKDGTMHTLTQGDINAAQNYKKTGKWSSNANPSMNNTVKTEKNAQPDSIVNTANQTQAAVAPQVQAEKVPDKDLQAPELNQTTPQSPTAVGLGQNAAETESPTSQGQPVSATSPNNTLNFNPMNGPFSNALNNHASTTLAQANADDAKNKAINSSLNATATPLFKGKFAANKQAQVDAQAYKTEQQNADNAADWEASGFDMNKSFSDNNAALMNYKNNKAMHGAKLAL